MAREALYFPLLCITVIRGAWGIGILRWSVCQAHPQDCTTTHFPTTKPRRPGKQIRSVLATLAFVHVAIHFRIRHTVSYENEAVCGRGRRGGFVAWEAGLCREWFCLHPGSHWWPVVLIRCGHTDFLQSVHDSSCVMEPAPWNRELVTEDFTQGCCRRLLKVSDHRALGGPGLLCAHMCTMCLYEKKTMLCHTWRSTRFLFPIIPVPDFPVSHFQRPRLVTSKSHQKIHYITLQVFVKYKL